LRTRLQIFRTGKHTAASGQTLEFSAQMLRDSVAVYDPTLHEAPIVIGHPREDAPAYGWISKLAFVEDGHIEAEPHQVDPQFAEIVRAGRYKKISAAFYLPDSPNNPKPGSLYLRHVGFLGAQPPAVKGLKNIEFAANEQGVIEFTDWSGVTVARIFRGIRELLIKKFGQEDADNAIPGWDIENLTVEAAAGAKTLSPAYAEPSTQERTMTPEEIKHRETELTARETKLQQQEAAFAERETRITVTELTTRRAECVAFCDQLISEGKLLPVHKDGVVAFMASLDARGVVEFGEGDKAIKQSAAEWFRTFLSAQLKVVDFNERGGGDADRGTVSFSAPSGFSVDEESHGIHLKACAYMKQHPGTVYLQAVKAVSAL